MFEWIPKDIGMTSKVEVHFGAGYVLIGIGMQDVFGDWSVAILISNLLMKNFWWSVSYYEKEKASL